MNINARIVKAVVTLPILGTVSRDAGGNIKKHGEWYRVHIYAANPGWEKEKPVRDFLVVGVLTGGGDTTESFKRSQEVILPEGRELVALRINDDGTPASWDSLPVSIDEGHTPFIGSEGKVFINEAFINGTMAILEDISAPEDSEKLRKLIDDAVSEGIRNSLRPGGLLHGR